MNICLKIGIVFLVAIMVAAAVALIALPVAMGNWPMLGVSIVFLGFLTILIIGLLIEDGII